MRGAADKKSSKEIAVRWLPAGGCALAGIAVFQFFGNANRGYIDTASLFYWWGFQWFNPDSETQHGLFILGLSGWLFWRNLREDGSQQASATTNRSVAAGARIGVSAMLGGLALHALGFVAQQARISIVALLLFSWGAIVFAAASSASSGRTEPRRWGRAAAFPLAFMLFAVPVNVLDSIGFWLRLWVIDATQFIARLAGLNLGRSGTQLFAVDSRFHYDVAAACSGVRSLMALAALSLLVGYLNFRRWPRRLAVLALCFPLTYLGNVVRIVSIVFVAEAWGQPAGERVHAWAGFVVFVIVLGGTVIFVRLWERFFPEAECNVLRYTPRASLRLSYPTIWRLAPAMVVVGLASFEMGFLGWLRELPPRGRVGIRVATDGLNPVELPTFLGRRWIGQEAAVSPLEREILPADTGFSRKLYSAVGDATPPVFVSVVLSGRDRTSIHRPELCLVGQGLTIESAVEWKFNFEKMDEAPVQATLLRGHREITAGREKKVQGTELVAYWFVGGDGVEPTQVRRLARDAWNRVAQARADRWAYVLVQTSATDGEASALARIQAVVEGTWPGLRKPKLPE